MPILEKITGTLSMTSMTIRKIIEDLLDGFPLLEQVRQSFPGVLTILAVLLLAHLARANPALAQNSTQNTNNQIVTVSSQSVANLITGRISFVTQPSGPSTGGGSTGSSTGGSSTGGTSGAGGSGGTGIPLPGKDHSALTQPFGGDGLLPGGAKTMFAAASDGNLSGLSAGDAVEAARLGIWIMGSMSWISNSTTSAKYNGDIVTILGGVDYKFTPKFMAGLAVGYQGTNLNTSYNNGWNRNTGFVAMSYASYSFLDNLVADASLGLTPVHYEISSSSPLQGQTKNGYDALRVLQATNLTYYIIPNGTNWMFSVKAGNMLSNEHDYFAGSKDSFLGELNAGFKASYTWKWLTVSAGGTYMFDYATQSPNDRNEIQALVGVKFQPRDYLSVSVEGYNSFLRAGGKFHNTGLSATLRSEF